MYQNVPFVKEIISLKSIGIKLEQRYFLIIIISDTSPKFRSSNRNQNFLMLFRFLLADPESFI